MGIGTPFGSTTRSSLAGVLLFAVEGRSVSVDRLGGIAVLPFCFEDGFVVPELQEGHRGAIEQLLRQTNGDAAD